MIATPDFNRAELIAIGVAVEKYRALVKTKHPKLDRTPTMDSILRKIKIFLMVEAELEAHHR